tara:strand:- start:191 stop:661 length:471 start_codon:yes stop_codon:yes gene_type:complete
MSTNQNSNSRDIQAKLFDFAISELIIHNRETFQPLWSVDSWAKFLIWLSLNCGLSGNKESLQFFAEALGNSLSSRMRRLFFERKFEDLGIVILADPAELSVFLMPISNSQEDLPHKQIDLALKKAFLLDLVNPDQNIWHRANLIVSIPWKGSDYCG